MVRFAFFSFLDCLGFFFGAGFLFLFEGGKMEGGGGFLGFLGLVSRSFFLCVCGGVLGVRNRW